MPPLRLQRLSFPAHRNSSHPDILLSSPAWSIALTLPYPHIAKQPSVMSFCKVIGVVLCLQLLSYSASAQNAVASATATSGASPSPTPAAGSTSYASAIANALSSGNTQAAANAIAAAQSAGQSSAYAAAFAQVSINALRLAPCWSHKRTACMNLPM